jgi:simple sugar transport system ATP-binding protein
MPQNQLILEARNISKTFGPVTALQQVSFALRTGEIHGLLGENGAGKSTLMNILYGLYHADSGELFIDEQPVKISSPRDSIRLGIGMIHQSSTLVPEFSALENIILGMPGGKWVVDVERDLEKIQTLSVRLRVNVPWKERVKHLSAGEKQKIEILRALYRGARVLILDEPTTSLVEDEFEQLLASLQLLTAEGVSVIFITHKIREVLHACDRASVLRGGVMQGTLDVQQVAQQELVALMFGKQELDITDSALPVVRIPPAERSQEPVCSVRNLTVLPTEKAGVPLSDISFDMYGGEILGIAGISGNGQKTLAESLIHPQQIRSGEIIVNGQCINTYSTTQVFHSGVFYTPEDRKSDAMLPLASITENMLLGHHREPQFVRHSFLDWPTIRRRSREMIREYEVKTPDEHLAISKLSGGNIQRVVIGRALLNPILLLIAHNPTSGLDMASVKFVFEKMSELKQQGSAVLYINEDLDELMLVCDRIGVLYGGRLVAMFQRNEFDKHAIGTLMIGG